MRWTLATLCSFFLLLTVAPAADPDEARLLRFADIHEDRIAFVHAGDVWVVDAAGGLAALRTALRVRDAMPEADLGALEEQ